MKILLLLVALGLVPNELFGEEQQSVEKSPANVGKSLYYSKDFNLSFFSTFGHGSFESELNSTKS